MVSAFIIFTSLLLGAVTESFGPGCGPIFFDNVECSGLEEQLAICDKAVFGNCDHSQDGGVICALTSKQWSRNEGGGGGF